MIDRRHVIAMMGAQIYGARRVEYAIELDRKRQREEELPPAEQIQQMMTHFLRVSVDEAQQIVKQCEERLPEGEQVTLEKPQFKM